MSAHMTANSAEDILAKSANEEARILAGAVQDCNVLFGQRNLTDWLELLGIGFLVGSECFKNLGGTLLILHDYLLLPDQTTIEGRLLKLMVTAFYE